MTTTLANQPLRSHGQPGSNPQVLIYAFTGELKSRQIHSYGNATTRPSDRREAGRGLLNNPFMFCGGVLDGIAHIVCILPPAIIITFAGPTIRRDYEAHREEGSYYRRQQWHRPSHGPTFSSRKARRSPLPAATRRRWMKRSPNLARARVATALTSPLQKIASGSSQPWPQISGSSTLSSPMPASPGGLLRARPTRPFLRT